MISARFIAGKVLAIITCLLVATHAGEMAGTAKFQVRKTWSFQEDGVNFSNEFSGARLNGVTRSGPGSYHLSIAPETYPINDSAWYAFRVWSKAGTRIKVTLMYAGGKHRYRPQSSVVEGKWTLIPGVSTKSRGTQASFALDISSTPMMVAGHPLISMENQMTWAKEFAAKHSISHEMLGLSVQGRPIPMMQSKAPSHGARTLVIMTGQHPPEFSSIEGFRKCMDTLFADSPLAQDFRKHFNIAIFPLMNPDGWYHGHWRCNANGIDPNRSWFEHGSSKVPEVQQAIKAIRTLPLPVLFVDFHSTKKNVLYTGPDDDREPRHFVPEFHEAMSKRSPRWPWTRETSHIPSGPPSSNGPASRSWGTRYLNVPSITWEYADIASPQRISEGTAAGTEELMRLLLRLGREESHAALRLDFESDMITEAGPLRAKFFGTPELTRDAAFGNGALSLKHPGTYAIIPDFDYASKGSAISFWLKIDQQSLASADLTSIYSHGGSGQAEEISIVHSKSLSSLQIKVTDFNDAPDSGAVRISDAKLLDGKWHHLGILMTPGQGTGVYLNGIRQGKTPAGGDAINPSGSIMLGIDSEINPESRFKGSLDDLRIHAMPLKPYDLTAIRFPDWIQP